MEEKSDLNILILGARKKWHFNQQTWKNGERHQFGNYSSLAYKIVQERTEIQTELPKV